MNSKRRTSYRATRDDFGFSLIEVVLALGVAAFVLVALIGMLPVGLSNHRDAERETLAASIMSTVVTDLKNSPTNKATALLGLEPHPLAGASAGTTTSFFTENEQSVAQAGNALCRVEIRAEPSSSRGRGVFVRVTWPAQAPNGQEAGAVETYAFVPKLP